MCEDPENKDEHGKRRLANAQETQKARRLGVQIGSNVRTVSVAASTYDQYKQEFHTFTYDLEEILQDSVADDAGVTDEERLQEIKVQDEADLAAGSHIVPGSNSIRRDTITHLGTLITNLSKTSPEYGAGAIIGFKFSGDEKKINKLREHAWLKWPCIIDVYKILIEWFKDRKQVEHPRLNMAYPEMKLKTLSRTNGLVRDASIAGVDGSHVWGMFLRQEWKKLADYNAADAQETLALFLRRNLYVKARESFKDTGKPMFYKVNMHKAAMHVYGNNENIKQILQHTDTLRAKIERTEMRLGMHFNPAHNGIHPAHVIELADPS
jgi:hypothetical protein